MQKFTAQAQVTVHVPAEKAWQALVDPAMVKQYMFDTNLKADWKVGGAITYSGIWEGKPYQDHGKVLQIEPNKLLVTSYFSPLSGQADVPENYSTIRYELNEADGKTTLTIKQEVDSQELADYMKNNWEMVLGKFAKLFV